ncbi:YceI family protein [Deinococcus sp.]|uniref:YceI family protein n=1 Tax=Deinococcus sp. TaxID=47478 RepID=UPI003C7E0D4E
MTFKLPALICLLAFPMAAAQTVPYTSVPGSGKVEFAYRVTLIPVNGNTPDVQASATADLSHLNSATAQVTVALANLKTGIGLRDRHALDALGAREYPNVSFVLSRLSDAATVADGQSVTLTGEGTFTLRGVTKSLKTPIKLTRQGQQLRVYTTFDIHPQDYGVNVIGADGTTTLKVTFVLAPAQP